jgi:hypothetical protein
MHFTNVASDSGLNAPSDMLGIALSTNLPGHELSKWTDGIRKAGRSHLARF